MKKVIFSQILAGNGVTNFSGLFDENGLPVRVELEKNADGGRTAGNLHGL
mgnify:CR=1 FL=1